MPTATRASSLAGLLMVTSAALLFGVVAAFVKATALPTLVMLQIRSLLEWLLGVSVAMLYVQKRGDLPVLPQPETALHVAEELQEGRKPTGKSKSQLAELLVGPPHLWGWLVLRAFLYWGFLACWWLALTSMPIGDATTIVYTGPVWTATFAFFLLGERIDWTFYPIAMLDACGLVLITQPSFIFGSSAQPEAAGSDNNTAAGVASDAAANAEASYLIGALSALFSALIAGLLPVCTRKSKECFWTAVNHVSSALSTLVFTPFAFAIWFAIDSSAMSETIVSFGDLLGGGRDGVPEGSIGKWPLLVGATVTGFAGLALQTVSAAAFVRGALCTQAMPHARCERLVAHPECSL